MHLSRDRFPRGTLSLALLLTTAIIAGLGAIFFIFSNQAERASQRSHLITELRGQILRYDEALTMSAKMAASSGDFAWERRYWAFEAKLDRALHKALVHAPSMAGTSALRQTDRANRDLVAMEYRAFQLVAQQRLAEARTLLASPAYNRAKERYQRGMAQLRAGLQDIELQAARLEHNRFWLAVGGGATGLLALAALWGLAFRALYRWRAQRGAQQERLLANLGEGVFGLDAEGCFSFLNAAAAKHLGVANPDSLIGRDSHPLIHHTDAEGDPHPAAECPILQILNTGNPLMGWQDWLWRIDGRGGFPAEINAAPLSGPDDRVQGVVVAFTDVSERKEREKALLEYRAAYEQSRDAIMFQDPGGFLDCNPAALTLFRVDSVETFRRLTPADLSPERLPDGRTSREAAQANVQRAYETGQAFFEWHSQTLDGRVFPTEVLLSRVDLDDGPVIQAVVRDITDRQQAFEDLRQARNEARQYFDVARVMMLVLDPDGRVADINPRGCEILGLGQEAILGRDWFANFLPEELRTDVEGIFQRVAREETALDEYFEHEIVTADGSRRQMAFRNGLLRDPEGNLKGVLSSGEDITDRKRMEAELKHQATHDLLTGVFNRRHFQTLLEEEAERAQRYGGTFALIMLDLDRFKAVNDTYGHTVGDEVLRALTRNVAQRLRESDKLGRWGGEEFMILLPETRLEGAAHLAEAIRQQVAGTEFPGPGDITISLGVTAYRSGEPLKDLSHRVDDALYGAKEDGRDRVVVLTPEGTRAPLPGATEEG